MRFLVKVMGHWRLYLLLLILTTVVGTVYGVYKLSVYESTTYIYVRKPTAVGSVTTGISGNPYSTSAQNAVAAINELLPSETFVLAIAQSTDLAKKYDLSSQAGKSAAVARVRSDVAITTTTIGPDTFTITVDDKDPHVAQQLAQSVVDTFTAEYAKRQVAYDAEAIQVLEQQVQNASALVTQDSARINQYHQAHPETAGQPSAAITDPVYAQYQQQYTLDLQDFQRLSVQLGQLKTNSAVATSGGLSIFNVYDKPKLATATTFHFKQLISYILAGLGGGLAVVALICGMQTLADKSINSRAEVRAIAEDLDFNNASIEQVPLLHGIGEQSGHVDDRESTYSGVLMPVLTVLPQMGAGAMTQEIRRVVGAGAKATRHD